MKWAIVFRICGCVILLTLPVSSSHGQNCGDFNGDGQTNAGDVVAILQYLFEGGPPPVDYEIADFDDHELLTMADATLMVSSFWTCDLFESCPPDQPPHVPDPSSQYRVLYTESLPAGRSSIAVNLILTDPSLATSGLCFPLRIRIAGEIPVIDSVLFPLEASDFDVGTFSVDQDSGYVALGGICFVAITVDSPDRFATLYLSLPPQPYDRAIELEWVTLTPEQAPPEQQGTVQPMLVGYCLQHVVEPELTPHCCIVPGDADGDGIVNVSDVVLILSYIFVGSWPCDCRDELDADGNDIVNVSDAVYLITYVFAGGPAPVCGTTNEPCF